MLNFVVKPVTFVSINIAVFVKAIKISYLTNNNENLKAVFQRYPDISPGHPPLTNYAVKVFRFYIAMSYSLHPAQVTLAPYTRGSRFVVLNA